MKKSLLISITIVFLCLYASNALAETVDVYWTGDADNGKLVDPCNWNMDPNDVADKVYGNLSIVPGQTDIVVEAGDNSKNFYGWRFPSSTLLPDGNTVAPNSTPMTLSITGGKLRTWDSVYNGDTAKGYVGLGHYADTNATLNMSGGEIDAGSLLLPRAGSCVANITGGNIRLTNYIRMGEVTGHDGGTVNMTGGTLTLIDPASTDRYIGLGYKDGGVCTFNFGGSATINGQRISIGQYGPGILNVTGGTMNIDNGIRVSTNGGDGTFNVEGGVVNIGGSEQGLSLGYYSDGFAEVNVSGGTINTSILRIGRKTDGLFNLSGGNVIVNYQESYSLGLLFDEYPELGGDGVLNLCGGTLEWKQYDPPYYPDPSVDDANTFDEYIAAGKIVAYNGSGRVIIDGTTIYADDTSYAPVPDVNEECVNPDLTTVSWTNPGGCSKVDVWFGGTDANMTGATKIVDGQLVSSTTVAISASTPYYWRVDTYDSGNVKTEGVVWNFTTNAQGAQLPCDPNNGAVDILKAQILGWDFVGTFDTVNINIGTSEAGMVQVASQLASDTDFFYSGLEYDTTYYWRIDSVLGATTTQGPVWSFTTVDPQCQISATAGDLDGNCEIDFADFAVMASNWLDCGWYPQEACN